MKKVAHKIVKTDKSQDLQGELASWRPRRAHGAAPVQVQRPENPENSGVAPV